MKTQFALKTKIYFLISFMLMILLSIGYLYIKDIYQSKQHDYIALQSNKIADLLISSTGFNAIERGISSTLLSSLDKDNTQLYNKILDLRAKGDSFYKKAVTLTDEIIQSDFLSNHTRDTYEKLKSERAQFIKHREVVNMAYNKKGDGYTPSNWIRFATTFIFAEDNFRQGLFYSSDNFEQALNINLSLKSSIWQSGEYTGRIRAIIGSHIGGSKVMTAATTLKLKQYWFLSQNNLNSLLSIKGQNDADEQVISAIIEMEKEVLIKFNALLMTVLKSGESGEYTISAGEWISQSTKAINYIIKISSTASLRPALQLKNNMQESNDKMQMSIGVLIFTLLMVGFFFLYFDKFVIKPIDSTIQTLIKVTRKMEQASYTASESSISLSGNSTEQASSIQETASALEELTAMVGNNVGQAELSRDIAEEMKKNAGEATETSKLLAESMEHITKSNSEIQKLVNVIEEIGSKTKIIDDIVFQTKILSFNASVEAERAGEYGRGFSVVAQEVSNLAEVSGKAAGEISTMVGNSVKAVEEISKFNQEKVESGAKMVTVMTKALEGVNENSVNILETSGKILLASKDQASGISQVNEAISQLDTSTQHIATLSHESAEQGRQLDHEAKRLKISISKLIQIVLAKTFGDSDEENEAESLMPDQFVAASANNNVVTLETKKNINVGQFKGNQAVGAETFDNVTNSESTSSTDNSSAQQDDDAWSKL